MHRYSRLLLALSGLVAAGAVYAHPGNHPHAHPHLDVYTVVVALAGAAAGIAWGLWRARRNKRPHDE